MFDVAPTELLLVAIVALVVIGPKDLPKAMRFVGYWVGKARGVARQFRSGFDAMVREAELAEMEKAWAEDNARIMRLHAGDAPATALPAPDDANPSAAPSEAGAPEGVADAADAAVDEPVIVEKPDVGPAAQKELPLPPPDRTAS